MAWTTEQLQNAQTIISVGQQMGMTQRDIQIALMAALVESRLVNVHYGDRDSLGLFQQRAGWGSEAQRMNPTYAATAFYNALKQVGNRDSMSMGEAAQAVQRSAYPDRYADWQDEAAALMGTQRGQSGGGGSPFGVQFDQGTTGSTVMPDVPIGLETAGATTPPSTTAASATPAIPTPAAPLTPAVSPPGVASPMPGVSAFQQELQSMMPQSIPGFGAPGSPVGGNLPQSPVDDWRKAVISAARSVLGTPYVWGGNQQGGFDCSGLVQWAFKQAGITMPRISYEQANYGQRIAIGDLQPGDLVAWDNSSRNNGADHISIYLGDGLIIEAPRPGMSVQISHLYDLGEAWGVRLSF